MVGGIQTKISSVGCHCSCCSYRCGCSHAMHRRYARPELGHPTLHSALMSPNIALNILQYNTRNPFSTAVQQGLLDLYATTITPKQHHFKLNAYFTEAEFSILEVK